MSRINRDEWYMHFDRGSEYDTDDTFAGPASEEFLWQLQDDLLQIYKILIIDPRLPKDQPLKKYAKALLDVAMPEIERLGEFPELFVFDEEHYNFSKHCEKTLIGIARMAVENKIDHYYLDDFVEECYEGRKERGYPGYWTGMKHWDQFLEDHPESFEREHYPAWEGDTQTLQVLPQTGLKILDHWLGEHDDIVTGLNIEDGPPRSFDLFTRSEEVQLETDEFEVDEDVEPAKFENTNIPLPLDELAKFLEWETMYSNGVNDESDDDEEEGTFWVQIVRQDKLIRPPVHPEFGVIGWEPEPVLSLTGEAPPSLP